MSNGLGFGKAIQETIDSVKPQTGRQSECSGLLVSKCAVCKKEISPDHVRTGTIENPVCMGCEGAEIEVWKVTLPGENNGLYEKDIQAISTMLEWMDEGSAYTITKETMKFNKFISLPEFQGF